jgi:hypothetical protein
MNNPTKQLPAQDVGAQTHRNYNYQSIHGVILLCAATANKLDYKAIWCEQEDDFLAEIDGSLFDSYQIKGKTPELGYWNCGFKGFISAMAVFLRIERDFPGSIRYYNFICEASPFQSADPKETHKCPLALQEASSKVSALADLDKSALKAINSLASKLKCPPSDLLPILKRLRFTPEPLRKELAIDALVATHLPLVPCCQHVSPARLRRVAVDVIGQIDEASKLSTTAPERHYACLTPKGEDNPQLLAKRVSVEQFVSRCEETTRPVFRYIPDLRSSDSARNDPGTRRFFAKLKRGGLDDQADSLRARKISAEAVLLELATRPEGEHELHHLTSLVKAECDDASILSNDAKPHFGPAMYKQVLESLGAIAAKQPSPVSGQPKEVLMGIAGLLTEECKVWWSEKFDPDEMDST